MARKDDAALEDPTLRTLARMQGGRDVLADGARMLATTPAAEPARRLLALFDAAAARGLGGRLAADLGEVRGFAYYTGTIVRAYARGTGDAVASGGRYDELLAGFGRPMPAAGFAIDLDRAAEVLRAAGVAEAILTRVVVFGAAGDAETHAASLRAEGTAAVTAASRAEALAWARAWGFTHVLDAATGASIAAHPSEGGT
jgi:ATP phosphoribosyltransferase regulatory subunit